MNPIRFIHMSDLHYRSRFSGEGLESYLGGGLNPLENIRTCLNRELRDGLDFVLITGDLTHEGPDLDFSQLREIFTGILGNIPVIALPGNHDPHEAFCRGFLGAKACSSLDFVHEISGLRILTLDTGNSINGRISSSQLTWLEDVLSVPSERGSLLALHHPLIAGQDGLECAEYPSFLLEVIQNSDILGIFCGHTHRNYFSQFAKKPYHTAGSMSFTMTMQGDEITYENYADYNLVTLSGKTLSAQVKPVAPESGYTAGFSIHTLFKN